MHRLMLKTFLAISLLLSGGFAHADDLFQDGDLVVFLGGTLVERAQEYGHWEAAIQLANPDKTLHIRNFGWSGDTVWADSRGEFDPPAKGYERMIEQVTAVKPDVIIFGYGNAEALDRPANFQPFATQLRKLVTDLPDARKIFIEPTPMLAPGNSNEQWLPSISGAAETVRQIAAESNSPVWSLAHAIQSASPEAGLLDRNGIHLTDAGYRATGLAIARQIAGADAAAKLAALREGEAPAAPLHEAIVAKDRLVFYRWRPQNITYLALFRKHEQGNNYAEIPKFDPLIDKADAEIDRIKRELAH